MKKMFGFVLIAGMAAALSGCASTGGSPGGPPQGSPAAGSPAAGIQGVPDFVNAAYLNASEDVLIGVGTYKVGNDPARISMGMTYASTRARADISRQLDSIVKNMVIDYSANSELDPDAALSFQETITQALSKSELRGARPIQSQTDANGVLWVVVEYGKSSALTEAVNPAVAAAKLAVPAAAAFDALSRMDTSFSKGAGGGPVPVEE
ncbi:MAG: hypothetical protein LBK63_14450 [Treponema sp.]|jgi:hypothetical protein|nr:hypothetical protein [Treponema sp.]